MFSLALIVGAYFLGSIPFAVVSSKLFSLPDPRTYGSGNPGATNVLRSGKKAAAALTLIGDAAKGWLAVFLAIKLGADVEQIAMVALMAFLGHVFSVFLKFQGGKGVATALGVLLALNVWLGLGALVTWLLVAVVLRLSSLAALVAAGLVPVYAVLLQLPAPWLMVSVIMSLLLIWRHKSNIQKLMSGQESKIGKK